MERKSVGTAYLLWFFLGALGVHKFYLNKPGIGILYAFTLGLFGIGLLIDLFTLSSQVETYNIKMGAIQNRPNQVNTVQNVVVNLSDAQQKALGGNNDTPEKQILLLAEKGEPITLGEIIKQTNLDAMVAKQSLDKLVQMNLMTESHAVDGQVLYIEQ